MSSGCEGKSGCSLEQDCNVDHARFDRQIQPDEGLKTSWDQLPRQTLFRCDPGSRYHEELTYRFQGREFRLTDVHGKVVKEILA